MSSIDERREGREKKQARHEGQVLEFLKEVAGDLMEERPLAGISLDQVDEILGKMRSIGKWGQTDGINFLRRTIVGKKRKTGGQCYLPHPVTTIVRDRSPLDANLKVPEGEGVRCIHELRLNLCGLELTDINAGLQDHRECAAGVVLLSAIYNGGMINSALVRNMLRFVSSHIRIFRNDAWIDFPSEACERVENASSKSNYDIDSPVRRWFFDAITLGLLTKFTAGKANTGISLSKFQKLDWEKCIDSATAFLIGRGVPFVPGMKIKAHLNLARFYFSIKHGQLLVGHLTELSWAPSMTERSWYRFRYGLRASVENQVEETEVINAVIDSSESSQLGITPNGERYELQDKLFKQLQNTLKYFRNQEVEPARNEAARRLREILNREQTQMMGVTLGLYHWAIVKLESPRGNKGVGVQVNTLINYFSRAGQFIHNNCIDLTVDCADEKWTRAYAQVLDQKPSDTSRSKVRGLLAQFHQVLLQLNLAPAVMIDGVQVTSSRVRNSVISEQDFKRIVESIRKSEFSGLLRRQLEVFALFMFRLCMRPGEAESLQLRGVRHGVQADRKLHITDYPVIEVKDSSVDSTKTLNGSRRIPVVGLLDDDEFDAFASYYFMRSQGLGQSKGMVRRAPLFSDHVGSLKKRKRRSLANMLIEIARKVLGDNTIVAHSFRHSGLTNLVIQAYLPNELGRYEVLRRGVTPRRELAHDLARIAGHGNPDVLVRNYLHVLDYIFYRKNRLIAQRELHLTHWESLTGISKKALDEWMKYQLSVGKHEGGFYQLVVKAAKKILPSGVVVLNEPSDVIDLSGVVEIDSMLGLDISQAYGCFRVMELKFTNEMIADYANLGRSEVASMRAAVAKCSNRKVADPKTKAQHPHTISKKTSKMYPESMGQQIGRIAPGITFAPAERREGERIYKFWLSRVQKIRDDQTRVEAEKEKLEFLIERVNRSEASLAANSLEELKRVVGLLKEMRISTDRIKIRIISVPKSEAGEVSGWDRKLKRLAGLRSGTMEFHPKFDQSSPRVARGSAGYDIGRVDIQVRAPLPDAAPWTEKAGHKATTPANAGFKAASGWREGVYYAAVVISAYHLDRFCVDSDLEAA